MKVTKESILKDLHQYNEQNKDTGFSFVSLFGSYARGTQDIFSDIDLTYKIDNDKFYKDDAFAQLAKIQAIKKDLELMYHKKVDLIPANTNNNIINETLKKEQIII